MCAFRIGLPLLLLVAALPGRGTTLHVPADYGTIQAAIDAATSGDEIVLSDGTFTGPGNWDLDFGAKELVLRSENGFASTILDCGANDDATAQHQGILVQGGQSSATRIEGITIEYVRWTGPGGAIRCQDASPTIRDVHVRACTAEKGRGLCILVEGGQPTIERCVFESNALDPSWSVDQASLICSLSSEITLQACTFGLNVATRVVQAAGGTISDCTFFGNRGTCVVVEGYNNPRIRVLRSLFLSNIGNCLAVPSDAVAVVGDCLFKSNAGGSVVRTFGTTTIRSTRFMSNSANTGVGSAVHFIGPLRDLTLDQCVFWDNEYGPVSTECRSLMVTRCTFVGQRREHPITVHRGSALTILGSGDVTIDHTIIAFGGPNWNYPDTAVYCAGAPSLQIHCTDIFGNEGGDWTACIEASEGLNGNFSADPLFCDMGDPGLKSNSPCAPANSGACGLIGALGTWCAPVTIEQHSWGSIKALYR